MKKSSILVFLLCLAPLLYLAWKWQRNDLGINSIEYVARYTGKWTLRLLLVTLAITPLRHVPRLNGLIRYRRMLGLFTFTYGFLHGLHYFWRDAQWYWEIIVEDLTIRRFFIAGAISLLLMAPLAATSSNAAIRWMGGKRWRWLHRLIYLSAVAAVIHYLWQAKGIDLLPLFYAAILALLLALRVFLWWDKRKRAARPRPSRPSVSPEADLRSGSVL
jgi:sulfoxide reductase heme-binding subunit YedZ